MKDFGRGFWTVVGIVAGLFACLFILSYCNRIDNRPRWNNWPNWTYSESTVTLLGPYRVIDTNGSTHLLQRRNGIRFKLHTDSVYGTYRPAIGRWYYLKPSANGYHFVPY